MYVTKERIGASKTDTNGFLKLSEAANMLQDCSLLWMESEPSFQKFMTDNNLGMFLTSRQIDILRLPLYGEEVTIQTSIFDCNSLMGYRNTVIFDKDKKPCLLTWSTGTFVNLDSKNIMRLPKSVIDNVVLDKKINMEYANKKIILPHDVGTSLSPIPVRKNDIDLYHHMNNAKYLELSLELLSSTFTINRIRIEYKRPAKLGDLLYPITIDQGVDSQYIILSNEKKAPYTVFEFT